MVSEVEFDPAPATTGTRLFTVLTVNSTTRWCSSCDSVADSPVVPQGTMTSVPLLIWNSMRSPSAFSSTLPFLNGVTIATMEPLNIGTSSGHPAAVRQGCVWIYDAGRPLHPRPGPASFLLDVQRPLARHLGRALEMEAGEGIPGPREGHDEPVAAPGRDGHGGCD